MEVRPKLLLFMSSVACRSANICRSILVVCCGVLTTVGTKEPVAAAYYNMHMMYYWAPSLYNFTSHTFTNAGVTGNSGPTLAQIQSAYSGQSWAANTSYLNMTTQGVQIWTVPKSAWYNLTVAGAKGGNSTAASLAGGSGRIVSGSIWLNKSQQLYIVVGQPGTNTAYQASGGGGSYIYVDSISSTSYVLVAGGGGGATHGYSGVAGSTSTSGTAGGTNDVPLAGGTGGTGGAGGAGGPPNWNGVAGTTGSSSTGVGGNGGNVGSCGAGGGGGGGAGLGTGSSATFTGGTYGTGGGGGNGVNGGFGGGAGSGGGCAGGGGGGGGGGYSGGGGGAGSGGAGGGGGGGGSAGNATYVVNYNSSVGSNAGAGYVTITTSM